MTDSTVIGGFNIPSTITQQSNTFNGVSQLMQTDANGNFVGLNSAMIYSNTFATAVTTANQLITGGVSSYTSAASSITVNTAANLKFNLVNTGTYIIDFIGQVVPGALSVISVYPALTSGGTSSQPIGGSSAIAINSGGNTTTFHLRSIVIVTAGTVTVQPEVTQSVALTSTFSALTYTVTKVS